MALLKAKPPAFDLPPHSTLKKVSTDNAICHCTVSNWLGATRPIGLHLPLRPLKSRGMITNVTQTLLIEPILVQSKIGSDAIQIGSIRSTREQLAAAAICASALTAVAETQTATKRSMSHSSAPGKEKLPMLDDGGGGSGFRGGGYTPYYRGDDSGAGGGAGRGGFPTAGEFPWGDFFFFLFLLLLRFLVMTMIGEGFKNKEGKTKPLRRYMSLTLTPNFDLV